MPPQSDEEAGKEGFEYQLITFHMFIDKLTFYYLLLHTGERK